MPIKVSDKEFREIKGQLSLDGIMSKLVDYQKEQDNSLTQAMSLINSSLESLKSFERKISDLNRQETTVHKELLSLQREMVSILSSVVGNLNMLREAQQKENLPLIESLEKIAVNLNQKDITESINNLTQQMTPRKDQEWEFVVVRDQLTGQMESVRA